MANEKGEIVSSSEGEKKENVYEQEFFQKALKGESVISDVFSSPLTQKPVFVISYPIKENERVAGVFFGIADMGYFSRKYIDSISDGQKVYAYMITRKGLLASHPDKSLIMKLNINDLDFGREIMSEDQTLIIYNFKEVKRLGAVRKNPDTGWRVGVSVKMSDIMASVLFLRKMNFSIAFILVILITSVIHFIVKSVVKPVNHVIAGLTESSERVASASEQVGSASQKLAQTSSEEAASFEEVQVLFDDNGAFVRFTPHLRDGLEEGEGWGPWYKQTEGFSNEPWDAQYDIRVADLEIASDWPRYHYDSSIEHRFVVECIYLKWVNTTGPAEDIEVTVCMIHC
ncbi:MAG: hypothetical protein HC887_06135 [Desulfobacteraceae bacterium]|nr:hypothetical protein [Desulfobacteraceae bacterium]